MGRYAFTGFDAQATGHQPGAPLVFVSEPHFPKEGGWTEMLRSRVSICNYHGTGGGGARVRTEDLLRAKQALSQLSYTPLRRHPGFGGQAL